MEETQYRAIVEECREFGWLDQYQQKDLEQLESNIILRNLKHFLGAHQILAAIFLDQEYLEDDVAVSPSGEPLAPLESDLPLPQGIDLVLGAAAHGKGSMLFAQGNVLALRDGIAGAVARDALQQGFTVLRVRGRFRSDGHLDRVVEPLVEQMLNHLEETRKRDFLVFRGQYLQLVCPIELFPVRPGGVYNLDPSMNRLKLCKAILDLLLEILRETPVVLLAEEIQHFPSLGKELLAYLAWIVNSGNMGLSGLDANEPTLDQSRFFLMMTSSEEAMSHREDWLETMRRRGVRFVEL